MREDSRETAAVVRHAPPPPRPPMSRETRPMNKRRLRSLSEGGRARVSALLEAAAAVRDAIRYAQAAGAPTVGALRVALDAVDEARRVAERRKYAPLLWTKNGAPITGDDGGLIPEMMARGWIPHREPEDASEIVADLNRFFSHGNAYDREYFGVVRVSLAPPEAPRDE